MWGADEKAFACLSPCEIDFSPEHWTVRLANLPNTFTYFLNARDEFFHFGRFFVYDFVFHSHCIFRLDFSRSASTSLTFVIAFMPDLDKGQHGSIPIVLERSLADV